MVTINGEASSCAGLALSDYLEQEGFDATRIAVERNGEIVPKPQYNRTILCDGDAVEIVCFVGGG